LRWEYYCPLMRDKDYNSLTFPQFGFKPNGKHRFALSFAENGKVYNKRLGEMDIHLHRPIEGTIKHLIIKRQS
ncbi:transposase, partial [Bacillus pseudomycoides]